jgi:phosphoglycolate phosphatase-like HAD superfamily hydrolase
VTVFLDLDGPVLDTSERNFQVHRQLLAELGGQMTMEREAFWNLKRAGQSSAELLKLTSKSAVDPDNFKQRWLAEIEAPKWLEFDTVQPGALPAIQWLADRFTLVLVTLRQQRLHLLHQLEQLKLKKLFPVILSGSPLGNPGWETKRALIERSGIPPNGIIVGDTEVDIRAGKLLKLGTIALTCGIRDEIQLRKESPDAIAESLINLQSLDLLKISNQPTHT